MSQIKELDYKEKTVTLLAVLGGLLLLLLTLTKCQNVSNLIPLGDTDLDSAELAPSDLAKVDNQVTKQSTPAKDDVAEEPEVDTSEIENTVASLQEKLDDANDKNRALNSQISGLQSKASMAIPAAAAVLPTALDKNKANDLAKQLKDSELKRTQQGEKINALEAQVQGLTNTIDEHKRTSQGINTDRDAIKKNAEEKQAALQAKIDELSSSIKSGESTDVLTGEIAKVEAEWKKKLDDLRVKNEMEKSKYTNELKSELDSLRLALRKEKTKKVFANSAEDLAPSAQKLVSSLSSYEGKSQQDLDKLYGDIKGKIKGDPKVVVNFASGSSGVADEYKTKIDELLKTAKPNSYFIAVGYADTTGTASKNKALSSKRATKVVEAMKPSLKETQFAQAFYLGQTERFGDPENNRVVEIWELQD